MTSKECQMSEDYIKESGEVVFVRDTITNEVYPMSIGPYFDCNNGIYIGEQIQKLANSLGWRYSPQFEMVMKDDDTEYGEAYTWASDEAEEYLNERVAKPNHYFGSQPMAGCGCWGYWEIIDEELNV